MLRFADLGVTGAQAVEKLVPKQLLELLEQHGANDIHRRQFEPQLLHKGTGELICPLPWDVESEGTHRFFALIAPWLDILESGSVVCIDELETSMHPTMVMELLKLLFNEKENRSGAQIICTTHNPLLMDISILRRDQVWFTDKDKEGEAHLYPLTDYAPRKDESLIRGYMSGRYGAMPYLVRGLMGQRKGYEVVPEQIGEPEPSEGKTRRKVKPSPAPEFQP